MQIRHREGGQIELPKRRQAFVQAAKAAKKILVQAIEQESIGLDAVEQLAQGKLIEADVAHDFDEAFGHGVDPLRLIGPAIRFGGGRFFGLELRLLIFLYIDIRILNLATVDYWIRRLLFDGVFHALSLRLRASNS